MVIYIMTKPSRVDLNKFEFDLAGLSTFECTQVKLRKIKYN